MSSELKSYYVDLEDGYEEGEMYLYEEKIYEVIRIEASNQLMEVVEIGDEKDLEENPENSKDTR